MAKKQAAPKKTVRRPKPGTKVIVIVHEIFSERGADAHVFGGKGAREKAWEYVGTLLEGYLDERNRLGEERTADVKRALAAGKYKLAWSYWSTGQDEDDEVSMYEQENIEVKEEEVY